MNDSNSAFQKVGFVKDAHGIRGELFLYLSAKEATWLKALKTLRLVKKNGEALSFSVKSARLHKGGLILKTGEIRDRNEAESLKGCDFEIPVELLKAESGDTPFLGEVLGFKVIVEGKTVGTVTGFSSNTAQDLLVVALEGTTREAEIPFVEDFVVEIKYDKGEIIMQIPEGLLDLDSGEPVKNMAEKQTDES